MRALKWLGWAVVGIIAMAGATYGYVYVATERMLNRTYDVPLSAFTAPTDPAVLAEGERLARIGGCIGCHGSELEGRVFFDEPWFARVIAPDLTLIAAQYTDAELERAIRRGVRRDGRSMWAMPSPMFAYLSDEHLGAVIAYIRSVPPKGGSETLIDLRIMGRLLVLQGELPPLVEEINSTARPWTPNQDDALDHGRYLALTACSECHGKDLRGSHHGAPTLAMVAAYSPEAFARLMREGIALGERELGLMSSVARYRFAHFTELELTALHTFLQTMASAPGE